jgi:hypothetical protein
MDVDWCREVVQLHRFFEAWFRGELAQQRETFSRFEGAMHGQLSFVSPDGRAVARDRLIDAVWQAHGSWPAGDRIWIEDCEVTSEMGEMALVRYQEWQQQGAKSRGRLSTALLRRQPQAPAGVVWLAVHETWLPS